MAIDIGVKIGVGVTGKEQVDALNKSLKDVGASGVVSANQTAQAFRMLPAQMTDIATQLAGGQSPFLVLLQQGGQIKDMFGGFGAMFRGLATLLTPFNIMIGAIAATVGLLGKSFYDATKQSDDLAKSIALTGNNAGVSAGKINDLARAVEGSSKQTIGATTALIQQLASFGTLSQNNLKPVAEAIAKLSDVSGQSMDELAKKFAGSTRNVSQFAAEMNRQIGYLTKEQFRYIQSLEAQGKQEEAVTYNARLLTQELERRNPTLSKTSSAFEWMGKKLSEVNAGLKGLFQDRTIQQEIERVEKTIERLQSYPAGQQNQTLQNRYKEQLAALKEKLAQEEAAQAKSAEEMQRRKTEANRAAEGTEDRLTEQAIQRSITAMRAKTDATIEEIQREQSIIDAARQKNLMTEEDYIRQSGNLKQREMAAQLRLQEEIEAQTAKTPARTEVEVAQRQTRIESLKAEIALLREKAKTEAGKTGDEAGVANFRSTKALREYSDGLSHQNRLIALQGEEVMMTSFAYKQLVAQKQFEYDLAQKIKDMAPQEAAAYRQVAEAAFKVRQELEKQNEEFSKTAEFGARKALKDYAEDLNNMGKSIENAMKNAFRGAEDALVNFTMTGKFNFKDFANSIIKDLIRIQIRQTIMKPFTNWLSSLMPSFGGTVSVGPMTPAQANGGAWMGGVQKFADGGIVSAPTLFGMRGGTGLMGEAGPEAIMPLKRTASGKLGVSMEGNATNNVSVTVNVESGQSQTTSDNSRMAFLGNAISKAVQAELVKQKRPGGILATA